MGCRVVFAVLSMKNKDLRRLNFFCLLLRAYFSSKTGLLVLHHLADLFHREKPAYHEPIGLIH